MKYKYTVPLVLLLIGAGCTPATQKLVPPTPSETLPAVSQPQPEIVAPVQPANHEAETTDGDHYLISIKKPTTGVAKVDADIEAFLNKQRDAFIADTSTWSSLPDFDPNLKNSLDIDYETVAFSDTVKSFVFPTYTYMQGAAHPNTFKTTLSFDLATGEQILLSDVFKPGVDYLKILSDKSLVELRGRQGGYFTDEDWLKEGTAPTDQNFKSYAFTPEGILIYFDPYQVAPYVVGPQEVKVLYSDLNDVLVEPFASRS